MTNKTIYRFEREPGKVTVTTKRPSSAGYQILHRLIADEGMLLTKDGIEVCCIDTDEVEGWIEVPSPEEELEPVEEEA